MAFPAEPVGMEEAIGWHLRQQDHHDNQESQADAMDCVESARWHRARRLEHKARLAELEAAFPETARIAKADYDIECRQMGEAAD